MRLDKIFDNNERWISGKLGTDPRYFERLAEGQNPDILYIGCSDSRVTAEDMMGAQPGDLFVHRNIANLVPNGDINSMSVVKYAVEALKVVHVIVCGHYGCGGVAAAMRADNLGIMNPWLGNIRDVYRLHHAELDAIDDDASRYNRLVELNVQEQCINVGKIPEVQAAIRADQLNVHGWVFDIRTGRLKDLELDLGELTTTLQPIYRVEGAL